MSKSSVSSSAIEMFTIPVDYIKPFFGWVKEFRDDVELMVDRDKIYYSIVDNGGKVGMICSKLFVTSKNPTTFQIELDPLLKVTNTDVTYYMEGSRLLYKTENGKHLVGTLTDPKIKESLKDVPNLTYKAEIYLEKDKISDFYNELLNIVKGFPDSPLKFKVENNILNIGVNIENEYHEFNFENVETGSEDCISNFDVRYIINATKFYKNYDSIRLLLSNDYPCKFEYRSDMLHTDILIAPRILD